jgi:hypothetical protein
MNEKELRKPISIGIFTASLVPLSAAQDVTPPTFSNDTDDAGGSVYEGVIVNVSVYWIDDINLSTGIFRTNKTGVWQNETFIYFNASSQWFNTTINTTGYGNTSICWNQWANDTSNNWNTSMDETTHCFDVIKTGNLIPYWHPTSEINSLECQIDSMCPIEQNDTFAMDTNVTCEGGYCGSVDVEARYGNNTNMTLISLEDGDKPFYILSGLYPKDREITYSKDDVLSLSNDQNYLYIGSERVGNKGYAYVVNKTDWSLEQTLTFARDNVNSVDNDNDFLYLGSVDDNVYVVNKTDWSLKTTLTFATDDVNSVDNDNDYLYIGSADSKVYVVNKTDWSLEQTLTFATDDVNSVDNDNDYLYIGSADYNTYVVNKTDWSLEQTLTFAAGDVNSVDNDVNYVYIGSADYNTYVVNKTDWSSVANITNATDQVTSLSNDDDFVYMSSLDTKTYVIEKGGNWSVVTDLDYNTGMLSVDNDEQFLYTGSARIGPTARVYVVRKNAWAPDQKLKFSDYDVNAVDHDNDYLYIGSADTIAYVVDNNDWSSVANITFAGDAVNSISNDNDYLYIGSADDNVYVVNKTDWSLKTTLIFSTDIVNSVDNDNDYLYIGSADYNTYVVNKTDWSLKTTITFATLGVNSVDNDNDYVYIGSADYKTYVVNKTEWSLNTTLTFATDVVNSVDNDNDFLYIGSADKNVYVVNKGSWTLETTITADDQVLSVSNDRSDVFIGIRSVGFGIPSVSIISKSDWSLKGRITFPDDDVLAVDNDRAYVYVGSADDYTYVVGKETLNPQYLGVMDENDTAVMKWAVKATGELGSEWKLDNNYVSDIVENSTEVAWVRISILTNFSFTAKNESMQLYEDTNVTILDWDGNEIASQTLTSSNSKLSTNLWYDFDYDIIQTSPALNSWFKARFYDFRIDLNSTLEPQLVENYINFVPERSVIYSVYAVNTSQIINISNATLYFPKAGNNVTGIFHCTNWDFSNANCSSWEINHTSEYGAQENSTHIWFNVSNFDAYGIGNQEPLPNITEIRIYDVTYVADKETGGTLEDSGLNSTLNLSQTGESQYRFEIVIENEGTAPWFLEDADTAFQEGLNETWSINESSGIWYNVSTGKYYGGTFTNGNVTWNTSLGGRLDSARIGGKGYFNYIVTISGGLTGLSIVDFPEIPNNTSVAQNHTFLMNATVRCNLTDCGNVNGTSRYNSSEIEPNQGINTTNGTKPLFILGELNEKPCPSNPLTQDEECELTWWVNATGDLDTDWNLDILFSSNISGGTEQYTLHSKFLDNSENSGSEDYSTLGIVFSLGVDTENHLITITYPAIHVILKWSITDFGTLDPGTQDSPALGNDDQLYNISIPTYSSTVEDLWVKGTNLSGPGGYSIPVENISWSLTNNISTETALTGSYSHVASNLSSGNVTTTYYWIDVPYGKLWGNYNGTIYFKANTTEVP